MKKYKILLFLLVMMIYYLIIRYLFPICLPFVFAIIVYFVIQPVILFLEKHFHIYKSAIGISLLLVLYLFITFLLILICSYIIGTFFSFLQSFVTYYKEFLFPFSQTFIMFIQKHFLHFFSQDLLLMMQNFIGNTLMNFIQNLSFLFSHIPSYLFSFFIFIISTFFLVLEYDDIKELIVSHSSSQCLQTLSFVKMKTLQTLFSYLKCQLILTFFCFIVLFFVFSIFHYSSPCLFSFFISILDSLPFIGVGIVLLPMCLFYFIQGCTLQSFYIFLVYLFLNVIRNILEPRIMNKELRIPSFLLLLSMVIHFYLFGIIGLFLSPIHMSLLYSFLDYHNNSLFNL